MCANNVKKAGSTPTDQEFGPWHPGLNSKIPSELVPLSTLFVPGNVITGYKRANELSDFCGLPAQQLVAFTPKRLVIHEILIRVTADFTVPDGPNYEDLGISLRSMVATINDSYVAPHIDDLTDLHTELRATAKQLVEHELIELANATDRQTEKTSPKPSFFARLFGTEKKPAPVSTIDREKALNQMTAQWRNRIESEDDELNRACLEALLYVVDAIVRHRGALVGDNDVIAQLAADRVGNQYGSNKLGEAIAPYIEEAAKKEGYRYLPVQSEPVVMNVKGSSGAGKSTIRPEQRQLTETLGIPWEDFALISPDYWRKYLLDYDSLGKDFKYAAMLTGHELVIIDQKLDQYMASKATKGQMSHLLVDRFRFDSFVVDTNHDINSTLLTRFGNQVYLFFIITPPEMTVERAWYRGIETGRYKAVDDLIYHNIEAYTGIPKLFFSWASATDKRVHFEFLDNSVEKGQRPRTIAFGWNDSMTILDINSLLNIERFKRIDVDATSVDELYDDTSLSAVDNMSFLKECCTRMKTVNFIDAQSTETYGVLHKSNWTYQNNVAAATVLRDKDIQASLEAIGWNPTQSNEANEADQPPTLTSDSDERRYLLGEWPN